MRWQRAARFVVAAIGLACALALVAYSRHRARPVTPTAAITDKDATSASRGLTTIRLQQGDKESIEISADLQTNYADNRSVWKGHAHIVSDRGGHKFELFADSIETKGKVVNADQPGETLLNGNILVKTEDGLELKTDSATYDNVSGMAKIPGKLTFKRGRVSGEGVGATYERERNLLWLLDQAHVAQAADEKGAGAVDATAKSIELARNDKYMNLHETAKLVRPEQTLSADNISMHFTDDEQGVKLLEMRGHSTVSPAENAKNSPDMRADDIDLEFQADGETLRHGILTRHAQLVQTTDRGKQTIKANTIDLVTAPDGRTLTNLDAKESVEVVLPPSADAPGRTIRAPTLVASGDDKNGLKAAIFENDVTFIEQPVASGGKAGPERTGRSKRLTLDLNGQLGAISKAQFRDNVVFKDDQLTAISDIADYDETKGTMLLTPAKSGNKPPQVDDGSVKVDGQSILIAMETHDLQAKGKVHMRMTPSKSATSTTHAPALFDNDKPVNGQASELSYVSKTKAATFTGPQARVYQDGGGHVFGDTIELEQETGNLRAIGGVTSEFVLETSPSTPPAGRGGEKKPAPTKGAANELVYKDAERKAVYTGSAAKVAELSGPDGKIEGQRIVLTLQQEQRALQTLEAIDTVWAVFDDGRETIAAHLMYDASTEEYALKGSPMHFKGVDNKNGQKSCTHETLTEMTYYRKTKAMKVPPGPGRPLKVSEPIECAASLKSIVNKK